MWQHARIITSQFYQWRCPDPTFRRGPQVACKNFIWDETSVGVDKGGVWRRGALQSWLVVGIYSARLDWCEMANCWLKLNQTTWFTPMGCRYVLVSSTQICWHITTSTSSCRQYRACWRWPVAMLRSISSYRLFIKEEWRRGESCDLVIRLLCISYVVIISWVFLYTADLGRGVSAAVSIPGWGGEWCRGR